MSATKPSSPSRGGSRDRLIRAARVLARLTRVVERACQDGGLSLPQYRLLLFISQSPQRLGELASRVAVSRPAITDLVDGLERQRLLRRVPVEGDRRGIGLELTGEGAGALQKAEESLAERLGPLITDHKVLDGLLQVAVILDRGLKKRLSERAPA